MKIHLRTWPNYFSVIFLTASFALHEFNSDVNELDDVEIHCTGNETKLVDCTYPEAGMHNCRPGIDEAGVLVICTGEYQCVYDYM